MEFSEILRDYRGLHELTQQNMVDILNKDADFTKITPISYHRWENGKVTPHVKKQAKILLMLNCRNELFNLCFECKRSVKFLRGAIKKRWDVRTFGVDYCYDDIDSKKLAYERLEPNESIPSQALKLQHSIYANREFHIMSDVKRLLEVSLYNYILLAHNDKYLYGQLGFHVMKVDKLRDYFDRMRYNKVNTLASFGLGEEEDVLFLSSFHTTRKEVFVAFIKCWIEGVFKLDRIPKFTYLRLYDDIMNTLVLSQFEPRLLTKGGTGRPRVQHISTEYEWLGYLVPTHLILLAYGGIVDCCQQIVSD